MQLPSPIRTSFAKALGRHLRLICLSFALAAILMACIQAAPEAHAPLQVPERQFILNDMRMEERRDGQVVWITRGKRSDGDLSACDVNDLVMIRKPQNLGDVEITIKSPHGHLEFDAGLAVLEDSELRDPSGRQVRGGLAHYDEKQGTLQADGPIYFTTPTMQAHATTALFHLKEGTAEINGPVEGRMDQSQISASSPQP